MLIELNDNNHYYVKCLLECLELVKDELDFDIRYSKDIPSSSIWVDKKPIAFIAYGETIRLRSHEIKDHIELYGYKIIFKHFFDGLFDYGKYTNRIIPCGLYRNMSVIYTPVFNKEDLISRARSIDIIATMRPDVSCKTSSILGRHGIIEEANRLSILGYNVRAGKKIPIFEYLSLLLDAKIGFVWQGVSRICWRHCEFIQYGVVMIAQSLGKQYPFANGAILEDDVNCVFCDDPKLFGQVAIELLNDKKRLERLRKNVVELWEEKLAPKKVGRWLYKKIVEVC